MVTAKSMAAHKRFYSATLASGAFIFGKAIRPAFANSLGILPVTAQNSILKSENSDQAQAVRAANYLL